MTVLDNIKKMAEQGCTAFTCGECPMKRLCVTGDDMDLIAKELLNSLSYDSDLSECKVGDWVWRQTDACWVQIESIDHTRTYPIEVSSCSIKGIAAFFTLDGKLYGDHKLPILFVKPPLCFNPEPKPETESPFKNGDKVWVRDNLEKPWEKAIYYRYNPLRKYRHETYADGKNAWTSDEDTVCWKYCKKTEEI